MLSCDAIGGDWLGGGAGAGVDGRQRIVWSNVSTGSISHDQNPERGLEMATVDRFEDHCWSDVIPPDDMRLYAPYARETSVGPAAAFLAIDLYNSAYRGGPERPVDLDARYPNSCGVYAHRAIEPTKQLFAAARRAGLPIFYCTQETRPNNRPEGAVSTRLKMPLPATVADLYGIYHEFMPEPTDVIITKQRASIFQGTPFLSHLNLLGIRSLIVCGESTSGCVRASAVDAYSYGFHVSIVEECTYDRAELTHKVNLFDLHHKYCDVMHLDEVVAHLDALTSSHLASAAE
jgi:nicotinamidase-related amidase